jgi:hypothetical protein
MVIQQSSPDHSTCNVLSGSDPTKDATYDILDTTNNNGIKISYTGAPSNPSANLFTIQITCDT